VVGTVTSRNENGIQQRYPLPERVKKQQNKRRVADLQNRQSPAGRKCTQDQPREMQRK
jgi:hypothetical protein